MQTLIADKEIEDVKCLMKILTNHKTIVNVSFLASVTSTCYIFQRFSKRLQVLRAFPPFDDVSGRRFKHPRDSVDGEDTR